MVEAEVDAQIKSAEFRAVMGRPPSDEELAKYRAMVAAVEPLSARVEEFRRNPQWKPADREVMDEIILEIQSAAQERFLSGKKGRK